jgi:Fe-S cluster biogenesis protein NfuA
MGVFRRRKGRARPGTDERLVVAVAELRQLIHLDGGEILFEEYSSSDGVVVLRVAGSCAHCDLTAETLLQGIEAHLRGRVPGIRGVRILRND